MKRFAGILTVLILLATLAGSFVFRQDAYDWYLLRNYSPDSEVAALADETTMTDRARKIFYVNRPMIADRADFNTHCQQNEQSIVLGCYQSYQRGIFLFDVQDDRLNGVKEVTAAHEMLHAAYDRLNKTEKDKLNSWLEAAFKQVSNARIKESIERYRQDDPSVVDNELHSILGSEQRTLPKELEDYYKRYFKDRLQVVSYSEQYEQAFIDRRNAVRDYDAKLQVMKKTIDDLSTSLSQESSSINAERNELNQLRRTDVAKYNSMVDGYNKRVGGYNNQITELESMVSSYNDTVQKRNSVASEEADLVESMDSRKVVPSQQ